MENATARQQWEAAAPGWARWEPTIATWMGPATEVMLAMAGVEVGARVVDLASGAGSQTLLAAQRVGSDGEVVANDIADTMLRHVEGKARSAGLSNVTTVLGAAEELNLTAGSFDAVVCRVGLMLFVEPATALAAMHRALRPGGSWQRWCSRRRRPTRSWPSRCRSCCVTRERRHRSRGDPGSSHWVVREWFSGCWLMPASSRSSSAQCRRH